MQMWDNFYVIFFSPENVRFIERQWCAELAHILFKYECHVDTNATKVQMWMMRDDVEYIEYVCVCVLCRCIQMCRMIYFIIPY